MANVDLHCHTSASFDCLADPAAVARRAAERGLTHLAITDHDTLDGALRARDAAPPSLTVIIGCEVLTTKGDLICLFLRQPIPSGLLPAEAIQAAREQGALIGIPHPFDHARRSLLATPDPAMELLAADMDWLETWNARVTNGEWNAKADALARKLDRPGIAVSDSHSLLEIGAALTRMTGDLSTPDGMREALRGRLEAVSADADEPATPPRKHLWQRHRSQP
jgi:predicted metal-dependent phosphoesterase TrpH